MHRLTRFFTLGLAFFESDAQLRRRLKRRRGGSRADAGPFGARPAFVRDAARALECSSRDIGPVSGIKEVKGELVDFAWG